MASYIGKYRRKQKQNEAITRQVEHDSLTIPERIEKAKSRRGESKREIAAVTATSDNAPKKTKKGRPRRRK
jgi:hypothetical protein